jgi:hypothetical protein
MMASCQRLNLTQLDVSVKGNAVNLAVSNALNANIVNRCKTLPFW